MENLNYLIAIKSITSLAPFVDGSNGVLGLAVVTNLEEAAAIAPTDPDAIHSLMLCFLANDPERLAPIEKAIADFKSIGNTEKMPEETEVVTKASTLHCPTCNTELSEGAYYCPTCNPKQSGFDADQY